MTDPIRYNIGIRAEVPPEQLPQLGIHYLNDQIHAMYKEAGVMTPESHGFDLVCVEDMYLSPFELTLIPLGIVVNIPHGYHLEMMPRSSSFKRHGIIEVNSPGQIDLDYRGPNDELRMAVMWCDKSAFLKLIHEVTTPAEHFDSKEISAGTRLCQCKLVKTHKFNTVPYDPTDVKDRSGFGSTGV